MFPKARTQEERSKSRFASHAGDWYTGNGPTLNNELEKWLGDVVSTTDTLPISKCKAIIAPHAGYAYSGATAAWAYKSVDTHQIKRVFILGPSHHYYLDGCALSNCDEYQTPIGILPLDVDVIRELRETGEFEEMSIQSDEDEHSIEMHLPYIRKIFERDDIKIVPILVGAVSFELEKKYGAILAPYLAKEDTFFVISSDFCHWGARFSYTYYYPNPPSMTTETPGIRLSRSTPPSATNPIHQSIHQLDHQGMELLTLLPTTAVDAHAAFSTYLSKTRNTICGRHPIGVLLGVISTLERLNDIHAELKWIRYTQSNPCRDIQDSSVSYASAWIKFAK